MYVAKSIAKNMAVTYAARSSQVCSIAFCGPKTNVSESTIRLEIKTVENTSAKS